MNTEKDQPTTEVALSTETEERYGRTLHFLTTKLKALNDSKVEQILTEASGILEGDQPAPALSDEWAENAMKEILSQGFDNPYGTTGPDPFAWAIKAGAETILKHVPRSETVASVPATVGGEVTNFHRNLSAKIVAKFDAISQQCKGPRFAWTELIEELATELASDLPPSPEAPRLEGETTEVFHLEGLTDKWRLIGVHKTLDAVEADFDDYKEWSKDAVAAWKGFRILRVTETREIVKTVLTEVVK